MDMFVILMLAVSGLFQFLASYLAFRLVKVTGKKYLWLLISFSLFLIGVRRIMSVYFIIAGINFKPHNVNEIIGVFSSFLLFFGLKWFHSVLTRQTHMEDALRHSERKFRETVIDLDEGFYSVTMDGILLEHNRSFNRILGFDEERSLEGEYLPDFWQDPDDRKMYLRELTAAGKISGYKINAKTINGKKITVLASAHLAKDSGGRPLRIEGVFFDITARIHAEERVRKLNRTLAMLSDINQAIVRIRDPQALFEKACRIAVEKGGFPFVWIGLLDNSTHKLLPAAYAGKSNDYFGKAGISTGDEPRPYCPVDRALRTGEHAACNDMKTDAYPDSCRELAIKHGFNSCISFPLKASGNVRGTVSFYAGDPEFFDEEEIKLLGELAADISFAMEFSDKEGERRRAEEEIIIRNKINNIFLVSRTDEEMYGNLLNVVLEVMESRYGVVGYIDENGALVVPSMTAHIWDKCAVPDKTFVFERETWGNSSWPRAIRERKANYTNEPSSFVPEGHIAVARHISMPIVFQGEAIGLIQVANKETDYTEKDVRTLELIGNRIIAPVLNARLQRNRQEEALKKAKEYSDMLIETANAIVVGLDAGGGIRLFNRTAEEITGYTREDIRGKNWFETIVPKDRYPGVWEEFNRLMAGGLPKHFENPILTKSGEERFIVWKNSELRQNGKITGTISFGIDITSRVRIEEALHKSEELFRNLFRRHAAVKLLIDPDTGNIIDANDAAVNYYGWPRERITGMKIQDINTLSPDKIRAEMEKAKSGEKVSFEFRHRRADGSVRDVEVLSSGIRVRGKELLHSIIHDITERKTAETEIAKLNRVYALISHINQMVVRTRDREKLFSEACRIAVEQGKFRMASVGLVDEKDGTVIPVAWHGAEEGFFTGIKKISLNDVPEGRGPTGVSIRERRSFFCNDIAGDPRMGPWRAEALKRGYRSSIAIPVIVKDKAIGSFNIYASEPGFFNESEIRLLEEVTDDIAYAVEMIEIEGELRKYREHLEDLVKQRTDELARGRNMLMTLIDSLPDEIYAKDGEGRFIMANYPVLRAFGLPGFRDILGKTDFQLLPEEEAKKAYAKEHSLLHEEKPANYEDLIVDKNGRTRWFSVTKVPIRDREGNVAGLVGINRDITYFKEAEEALKNAKEAAEAANTAKTTFLSSMSHEIRTPLNAILGFSQLMRNDESLGREHIEWLETINRNGEHLLGLINDILEVSKIEAGRAVLNPSDFDLHAFLEDIETMFRVRTEQKNLSLRFDISGDMPRYIVTDREKLRQVIINLVGNAVKFTAEGGISVKAYVKHENNRMRLAMEIEDTGPGIAEKDMDKLFRKFGQAEAGIREGGTGLGLLISRQYSKIMGGDIIVRSREGEGSCFTLEIEIRQGGNRAGKKARGTRRVTGLKPGQKRYRILIADDNAGNRELLKVMLKSAGFDVEEAQNGNEALLKFRAWLPDLVMMDMRMPVMDGYEAIRGIRAVEKKRIPVIAITAGAFAEDRQKALDAGADAYIRKPYKENEVFDNIRSCLDVRYVYKHK